MISIKTATQNYKQDSVSKKKEKKKVKKIHTFMIHETKRVMTGASLSSVLSVQTPLHECNSNTF